MALAIALSAVTSIAHAQTATTPGVTPETGKWRYTETASALDGAKSRIATLTAETQVANILGRMEAPTLGLTCDKNGLGVVMSWPDFVGEAGFLTLPVKWKIDDGKVYKTGWFPGTTSVTLMGPGAQGWIRQVKDAKTLVVAVPDRHGGQEATFDLTGIEAIGPRFSEVSCGGGAGAR
ncbi:hypothetical protein [Caulobacter sp. AP07]|uniref:hypothetical protein n=1 Tax=Caulobacter sp. AP07 TaxID=1144304 RepID=UPI0012F996B3|nr:hypothetical protein [Caulobacter sp. AP07]